MSKVCIIGHRGFIGSALAKRIGSYTTYPTKDTSVIYYFGSKTHMAFEENVDYHLNAVMQDFLHLLPFCKENGIKFVYASSALVYEDKDIAFIKCKKALELLASCYPNTIGLRIFPVYGPGENVTVISQWCKSALTGDFCEVYCKGKQERAFIFIDDVIDQILELTEKESGVYDVGNKKVVSFNEVLKTIGKVAKEKLNVIYLETPDGYSKKATKCKKPLKAKTTLEEGIRKIYEITYHRNGRDR